jgi:hypothetical protein
MVAWHVADNVSKHGVSMAVPRAQGSNQSAAGDVHIRQSPQKQAIGLSAVASPLQRTPACGGVAV